MYAVVSIVVAHTSRNFANLRPAPAEIPLLNVLLLDAQTAVNLFLVLSGFLVTYRLLAEQAAAGRLDVRRFLARRMARILPPYYATVAVGWLLVPLALHPLPGWEAPTLPRLILVLALLPIFATSLGPLEHIWYIGLLTQFYLIWPAAVQRPAAAFVKIALGILIVKSAVAPVIGAFHSIPTTNLFLGLRFESLAIGALGAHALFHRTAALQVMRAIPVRAAALGMLAALAVWDMPFTEPAILLSSAVFVVILLNFFTGSPAGRRLENSYWRGLGGLSYGIYLYHYPLLYTLLVLFARHDIGEGPAQTLLLHSAVMGGSLLLSAISYFLLERPFLRIKKKFSVLEARG
jgi:peptidoglycan/LPS O-acetylase OafA/YrhL